MLYLVHRVTISRKPRPVKLWILSRLTCDGILMRCTLYSKQQQEVAVTPPGVGGGGGGRKCGTVRAEWNRK